MWPFSKRESVPVQKEVPRPEYEVGQWVEFTCMPETLIGIITYKEVPSPFRFEGEYYIHPNGWGMQTHAYLSDIIRVVDHPETILPPQREYWITINPKSNTVDVESQSVYPLERMIGSSIQNAGLEKFLSEKEAIDFLLVHEGQICKILHDNRCLSQSMLVEKIKRALASEEAIL